MKKCPYCAEIIQDEAIVCRHCRRNLAPSVPQASARQPRRVSRVLVIGVGLTLVLAALLTIRYVVQERYLHASAVRISATYVSQLFLVDRPVHISDNPVAGVDFRYTGKASVGQVCNVWEASVYKSALYYRLQCGGQSGWLPAEDTDVIR